MSSEISVSEERPLNWYRTEIPNIVYELKLTPHDLALYNILRRTAGATGVCTKGARRLAEECTMSTGQVSKSKEKLCECRSELGGKPLIRVARVEDATGKDRHHVTIVDIWRENMGFFSTGHTVTDIGHQVTGTGHGVTERKNGIKKEPRKEEYPLTPKGGTKQVNGSSSIESKSIIDSLNDLFRRRASTPWSDKELRSFRKIRSAITLESLSMIHGYYVAERKKPRGIQRTSLLTLLNNYATEEARAIRWQEQLENEALNQTSNGGF